MQILRESNNQAAKFEQALAQIVRFLGFQSVVSIPICIPNATPLPTSSMEAMTAELGVGNWEWLEVGRWKLGVDLASNRQPLREHFWQSSGDDLGLSRRDVVRHAEHGHRTRGSIE